MKFINGTGAGSPTASEFIDNCLELPPVHPGSKINKAYLEGRENGINGGTGTPPFTFGTPEFSAFQKGYFGSANTDDIVASDGITTVEFNTGLPCLSAGDDFIESDDVTDQLEPSNTGSTLLNGQTFSVMTNSFFTDEDFFGLAARINTSSGGYKSYKYNDGTNWSVLCYDTVYNEWIFVYEPTNSDPETWADDSTAVYDAQASRNPSFCADSALDGDGDAVPDPENANVTYT